ncbi:hypothetical protein [Streptomyces sp. YU58]|uniref:hypothetical protein n=1 Tax=Streptomyces sp. SX92 TaxID=3158972 RepID=UPI0027B8AD9B|nr:hypothetical protein [Streptomyces coralus]WLW51267.1 hypothetical protein QU709_07825 [Streptomyces coralus]
MTAGRRAALRATVTALPVTAVAVAPSASADPHAFVEHVLLLPPGPARTSSPATSPLPDHPTGAESA